LAIIGYLRLEDDGWWWRRQRLRRSLSIKLNDEYQDDYEDEEDDEDEDENEDEGVQYAVPTVSASYWQVSQCYIVWDYALFYSVASR